MAIIQQINYTAKLTLLLLLFSSSEEEKEDDEDEDEDPDSKASIWRNKKISLKINRKKLLSESLNYYIY